jgi:hypothetical protein
MFPEFWFYFESEATCAGDVRSARESAFTTAEVVQHWHSASGLDECGGRQFPLSAVRVEFALLLPEVSVVQSLARLDQQLLVDIWMSFSLTGRFGVSALPDGLYQGRFFRLVEIVLRVSKPAILVAQSVRE